ncbi:hypothetical protein A9Q73_04975 [Bermanella sp. 47_1433_sub80_T6]|nr:hypothetical protein A9Q73_04975 [Bermanella sp. 47_1433_sub80_T6]
MMDRIERDFYLRDPEEQADFLLQTWCNECQQVDLGMTDPVEYELDGKIAIEGKCKKCGNSVTTEIAPDDGDDTWQ